VAAALNRRTFLAGTFASALAAAVPDIPIIDSHIHLFDVSRPQGVPWPAKDSPIYKSALPAGLSEVAGPHGVVGAIEIECSPWLADNQWVLDVAAKAPIIVGTIGDLEPGTPEFRKNLTRLHQNRLFRGIRYGNLWNRDLTAQLAHPAFLADLKWMARLGLVLDTANPDPALMRAVMRLSDAVPDLKIVLDHLPELTPTPQAVADLRVLGQRPQIFAKVSGIVRNVNGRVPLDIAFYRDRLDLIQSTFGFDRLLYGSDWPNCDLWASYEQVFHLAEQFVQSQSRANREKFFWRNSLQAYAWIKRDEL
jgi:L-fuconolactonase